MGKKPDSKARPKARETDRAAVLSKALRDNLKRRKAQARVRSADKKQD